MIGRLLLMVPQKAKAKTTCWWWDGADLVDIDNTYLIPVFFHHSNDLIFFLSAWCWGCCWLEVDSDPITLLMMNISHHYSTPIWCNASLIYRHTHIDYSADATFTSSRHTGHVLFDWKENLKFYRCWSTNLD